MPADTYGRVEQVSKLESLITHNNTKQLSPISSNSQLISGNPATTKGAFSLLMSTNSLLPSAKTYLSFVSFNKL